MIASTTRHTEATRTAIIEAAVGRFRGQQRDGFSIQDVADRAGLTHRTVYRYFPTRQELISAAARNLAPGFTETPFSAVSSVDEWIGGLGAHLAHTEANFEVVRRVLVAVLASDDPPQFGESSHDRDAHLWDVFRRQFRHLPAGEARRTFAA